MKVIYDNIKVVGFTNIRFNSEEITKKFWRKKLSIGLAKSDKNAL